MIKHYSLLYPSKISFGSGAISQLPEVIPDDIKKILLLVGNHFSATENFAEIKRLLHLYELEIVIGVEPEPPLDEIDRILAVGRDADVDAVVAVGGGSVIDTGKAVAALIPEPGNIADYFYGRRQISSKGLYFVAIPTTAGTGAEITKNSVLTDSVSKVKQSIRHVTMVSDVAIVDPELTVSCPPYLTAASGLDALTQAVESYISANANAVTRSLAIAAIEKIFYNLNDAYKTPDSEYARSEVAEGSLLSAMAFSQSGLGAVHGLAHPIGSLLHIPHGIICAILLLPILRWNMKVCTSDYKNLAIITGGDKPEDFIDNIKELCVKLEIPTTLADYSFREENFPFILDNCRSNSMKSNPRYMEDEDIVNILEDLL